MTATAVNDSFIPTALPSKRTAFGKTFQIGAGKYKSCQGVTQIHTWDSASETWIESDARFQPVDGLTSDVAKPVLISRGTLLTTICGISGD